MINSAVLHQLVRSVQSLLQVRTTPQMLKHAKELANECWQSDEGADAVGELWEKLLGEKYWENYGDDGEYMDWITDQTSEKNPFAIVVKFKGVFVATLRIDASGKELRYIYQSNETLN